MPQVASGGPRYSGERPRARDPPSCPRPRQPSLPPPRPRSEPTNTLFAAETWMDGSPSVLVPHPVPPTVAVGSWPEEKVLALAADATTPDRKSTRLNSSHLVISYAVFCLKKKKKQ